MRSGELVDHHDDERHFLERLRRSGVRLIGLTSGLPAFFASTTFAL
jgi:hypothetical protein